jgi:Fe-Mn family superoxide dismutase
MIELMDLPFVSDAYEPMISKKTIELHYGKHHRGYVDKVNILVIGTEFQDAELEDIIRKTAEKPEYQALYNNAGQVYNHNIYWESFGI